MSGTPAYLSPAKLTFTDIATCLRSGWRTFQHTQWISLKFGGLFAALGIILLGGTVYLGFSPMVFPLAGAFLLIAPIFLCFFFGIADRRENGDVPLGNHLFDGLRQSPPGLWVLVLVCVFLFLVWLTDAATVYSLYFGTTPTFPLAHFLAALVNEQNVISFLLLTALMGIVIAFAIFVVTAFGLPLLFYRRCDLAGAIGASVRGVFTNFWIIMAWACLLAIGVFVSLLLIPPAFSVVFPVLSYSGRALYRKVYPG